MAGGTMTGSVPYEAGMLIAGEKVLDGERIHVRNPAHPHELVGTTLRGTIEQVNRAVGAAKAVQPAWAARSFRERAGILTRGLEKIEQDIDRRSALLVRENGKPFSEARAEVGSVVARARLTLELAQELDNPTRLAAPYGHTTIKWVPYGVVVTIVPWNTPIGLAFLQIVPALLAGNSVVLKVPESCPLALTQMAELLAMELPAGLLNVISGLPIDIGDAITLHPDVDKIAFTGSITSARKIIANAGQSIKGVTAELGGNDAAIILDDVDLGEQTINRLAASVFRSAGQICMAIKRIYVPHVIHDRFVTAFCEAADRIVVGDGLQPETTMGPLHTALARERALNLIDEARRQGATIRSLGTILDETNFDDGFYVRPTVVTEIEEHSRLMVEEQFCPVIPIVGYGDVEEALSRANATVFGLGGSVWSKELAKATDVAQRIQAGTVFVNAHGTMAIDRNAPYGGVKQSGMGRRSGIEGLREYMQSQTLTTFEHG